jgi:HK97 family phage prohead protease
MTLERITVPIEWKAEDGDAPGTLTGYASTFGNVDLGGDVVAAGAFDKFVQWVNAAKDNGIPLLADHIAATSHVLGTIYAASTDNVGLKIKARLSKAPSVQDVATKMQEGHVNRLSIGYEAMDYAFEDREGLKVRILKEIKLWETSAVVFPMNPKAAIEGVKDTMASLTLSLKEAGIDVDTVAAALPTLDLADVKAADGSTPDTLNIWKAVLAVETKTGVASEPSTDPEKGGKSTKAPDEPGGAPSAPGEEPGGSPDATGGKGGWDRYTSEAMLRGRPTGECDPATRAGLTTRLSLAEQALSTD